MSSVRSIGLLVVGWLISGCQPTPPSSWDEGGAPLVVPDATLKRHDREPVQVHSDGRVTRDGEVLYFIDRAGRITDEDYESIALLTPTGHLVANDEVYWGRVGVRNASPPWSAIAWLRVSPSGALLLFDASGEPYHKGQWTGCQAAALRTCTLVSHLLTLASVHRYPYRYPHYYPHNTVHFGLGVGIWR